MTTIAYDRPVKDLVDALSATGHVTHTAFKKTSVTLHHNGGRLSHEGVLNVWKTRPASAHFDVDSQGNVAQYVKVNEYAWAVGNTSGNQTSISIEMANIALSPTWEVAEVTWLAAARLAGWLFFKVVGARPSSINFFQHKHWSATDCAGPDIGGHWARIMLEAQRAYDYFAGQKPPAPKPTPKPTPAPTVYALGSKGDGVSRIQRFLHDTFPAYAGSVRVKRGVMITIDGDYGPQTEAWVKEFQKRVKITIDGVVGPQTTGKMRIYGYKG